MWRIINALRILIVALITIFCSVFGVVLLLLTWNRAFVLYIDSQIWSRVIFWACGVKLTVKGRQNVKKGQNYIFICNHESLFDIPAVFLASPSALFFLAKKELAKVPVMGWFMWVIGMIFIDRGHSDKARRSMQKAGKIIRSGRNVITFPEGTRSKDGLLKMFKRGSFILSRESGIDLIPIGLEGPYEILPSGETRIKPGRIYANIGEVIKEADHRDKSIEQYAAYAQGKVNELIATAKHPL